MFVFKIYYVYVPLSMELVKIKIFLEAHLQLTGSGS